MERKEAITVVSVASISKSQSLGLRLFPIIPCALVLILAHVLSGRVIAQQVSEAAPMARVASTALSNDTRYRIGPGDVLSILVRKAPELSGAVRVDQRGMIRIPMIEGEVRASCRTEAELASQIATLYLEYKQNPSVDVFVSEFQSRPVAVIGAVNAAGQFRLQRQVRLLELLTFSGGPSPVAGRVIYVIHTGEPNICKSNSNSQSAVAAGDSETSVGPGGIVVYKLNDTLKGKEEANPFVQAGDIIRLPEADQVFIIGHVNMPKVIPLRDKTITVSWAIAMAGGAARDGKTSRVRIIRQSPDGETKQEIFVDLGAIEKRKAEDIALIPNDIVEVGSSTSKTILGILTGSVPGVLSQGVIRVIP